VSLIFLQRPEVRRRLWGLRRLRLRRGGALHGPETQVEQGVLLVAVLFVLLAPPRVTISTGAVCICASRRLCPVRGCIGSAGTAVAPKWALAAFLMSALPKPELCETKPASHCGRVATPARKCAGANQSRQLSN
jgi:hypothetical protein